VTLSYQNVNGEYVVETFAGLPARIAQHEFDHMEGLNFSDHVSQLKLDMALKSLNKRARKYLRKYVKQNV
jgi:peptide deformylase